MHEFSVWAPDAERVDVEVYPADAAGAASESESHGGPAPTDATADAGTPQLLALSPDPGDGLGHDGWWRLSVPEAGPGTEYAFRLDGGDPRPDPRSAWQRRGVHGPSRVVDTATFTWTDGAWPGRDARGQVVYELHVGTFTEEGTFAAAAQRLAHLVDLGVGVVELLPVVAFPGRWGWGYDGVDLFAVHDAYGGPAGLAAFVDAAHAAGLAVCLDVVYNHLGPSGNYLAEFGPYFTDTHDTPWGAAVNLDAEGSGEVRRFVVDAALRWLRDFHVDALRLDAVHALVDDSPEHLLAQLARETAELAQQLGRPLTLIAESDLNDPAMVTPLGEPTTSGTAARGMQAQWADDVHHAIHATLTGERQGYYVDFGPLDVLARVLTRVFFHDGRYSTFRDHDWGSPVDPARYGGHAFVAYTTTHDQTGNRATGDRLSATLDDGQLAIAAALVITSAYTPMIFMGEEWGARTPWQFFTDHDAELGALVSEGRAREFAGHGWDADEIPDPQDPATRDRSVLDWDEPVSGAGARLLAWHRDLFALRAAEPDLRGDDLRLVDVSVDADAEWLLMRRGGLALVVNLAEASQTVPFPSAGADPALDGDGDGWGSATVVLAWDDVGFESGGRADDEPVHAVTSSGTGQPSRQHAPGHSEGSVAAAVGVRLPGHSVAILRLIP